MRRAYNALWERKVGVEAINTTITTNNIKVLEVWWVRLGIISPVQMIGAYDRSL